MKTQTKAERAKTLVHIARQGYGAHLSDQMCVGKAFMMSVGDYDFFDGLPSPDSIQGALMLANPDLPRGQAMVCAFDIVELNTLGKMRRAWDVLEHPLAA